MLDDGTAIGEVPAIMRYLDEAYPKLPLLGATPKEKALITMWERRAELEGFASVMEGVRNAAAGLKGRAISGSRRIALRCEKTAELWLVRRACSRLYLDQKCRQLLDNIVDDRRALGGPLLFGHRSIADDVLAEGLFSKRLRQGRTTNGARP